MPVLRALPGPWSHPSGPHKLGAREHHQVDSPPTAAGIECGWLSREKSMPPSDILYDEAITLQQNVAGGHRLCVGALGPERVLRSAGRLRRGDPSCRNGL